MDKLFHQLNIYDLSTYVFKLLQSSHSEDNYHRWLSLSSDWPWRPDHISYLLSTLKTSLSLTFPLLNNSSVYDCTSVCVYG